MKSTSKEVRGSERGGLVITRPIQRRFKLAAIVLTFTACGNKDNEASSNEPPVNSEINIENNNEAENKENEVNNEQVNNEENNMSGEDIHKANEEAESAYSGESDIGQESSSNETTGFDSGLPVSPKQGEYGSVEDIIMTVNGA